MKTSDVGRKTRMRKGGFSLIEIMISIGIVGILGAAAIPIASNVMEKAKSSRADQDLATLQTALFKLFTDTQIPPGWRSCPDAGGNGTTNSVQDYLTTQIGIVKDASNADLATNVEDLDNHLYYPCSGATATVGTAYDSAGGSWKGPYTEQPDHSDPWGKPYVLMIEDFTATDPGLIMTAANEDTILNTTKDANTVDDSDLGKPIILR